MIHSLIISLFLSLFPVLIVCQPDPSQGLVNTTIILDYGTFNGFQNSTTGIISFRGIRYADAPTGNLRWRTPVSPPSNNLGIVNATEFAVACIRTIQTDIVNPASEDCLFGNVYVPNNTRVDDSLPVLVWFHGGGYQTGNTHDAIPDFIMNSSIDPFIFASFEYRLGQFGFLGGSDIQTNGTLNAGLHDQRAALKWVQRYINQFGGDNSTVTVWGQSAGAGSIMFHLMSNDTEGLFNRAIAHSTPTTYTPEFNTTYDENIYQEFSDFAECTNTTTSLKGKTKKPAISTLDCLRAASTETLMRAGSKLAASRPSTLFVFAPVFDDDLIKVRPVEAFRAGRYAHVPILAGSNTNEGSRWSSTISDPLANTSMPNATEATVFNFLHGQYSNLTAASVHPAFSDLYPLTAYNNSFSLQGQQMYGELRFSCSALMVTPAVPAIGNQGYQYHYDNPHLGSDHESELKAFFGPADTADAGDLALFETMRQYWTSFVTSGQPIAATGPPWHTVNIGNLRILLNPEKITMEQIDEDLISRCAFWHGITNETLT